MCHEHVGKSVFPVKHFHHGLLVDSHHGAIGHCGCGTQTDRLPRKATFPEEIALVRNAYGGFLPDLRHNGEFYLPFLLYKKRHRTSRPEQRSSAFLGNASIFLPPLMVERNVLESNLMSFLAATMTIMIGPLSRVSNAQKARMNAQEGENNVKLASKPAIHSTK
jgi:hypothetical protein